MSPILNFAGEHARIAGSAMPDRTAYGVSEADVLARGRGFIGGFDFTLQTQVGCPAACQFCYVRRGARLAPADVRRNWGFVVRRKRRVAEKWRAHLDSGELAGRTVYWSGVTDPYSDAPVVTRAIWTELLEIPAAMRPRRIAVQSRFRVDRDVDLIAEYVRQTNPSDGGPPVVVSLSIGTDRDDLIAAWERATPRFESRMATVSRLCDAGVCVVVTLSPFCVWNDLQQAAARWKEAGVPYLTVLFYKDDCAASLTPPAFLARLMEVCPEVLDRRWQRERLEELMRCYGADRVIPGRDGFASLTAPHRAGSTLARDLPPAGCASEMSPAFPSIPPRVAHVREAPSS